MQSKPKLTEKGREGGKKAGEICSEYVGDKNVWRTKTIGRK